jgi:hypothetical protein
MIRNPVAQFPVAMPGRNFRDPTGVAHKEYGAEPATQRQHHRLSPVQRLVFLFESIVQSLPGHRGNFVQLPEAYALPRELQTGFPDAPGILIFRACLC